jgi:Arylsulfotransferase (ASST)
MKHFALEAFIVAIGINYFSQLSYAQENKSIWKNPEISVQTGTPHPFVCTDYTQGKVFVVSKEGKIEWEYAAPHCNDIWILPNGNLLFNTGKGIKEVTRTKKIVFNYDSKSEIYACQRLPNGNTFIGECDSGRLLEVSPAGSILKDVKILKDTSERSPAFMRNARKLENGNYLVAHYGLDVVREYDPEGNVVREIKSKGGPHSAVRLPNGNTLIACADHEGGPKVFEVDSTGKVVWEVTNADFPDTVMYFMTGLQRLPNGNTVMTNWLGHNNFGKAPHIIEITHDKKIVWTFSDHDNMKTISSIQVMDVSGDVTKGEIQH